MGCDEVTSSGIEENSILYMADRLESNPSFHTVYTGLLWATWDVHDDLCGCDSLFKVRFNWFLKYIIWKEKYMNTTS
jgi:hypothetical protein